MKHLILIFFAFSIACAYLQAQPPHFQERMKQRKAEVEQAKKEIITARINLKPEQEKNFWEVYDKYIEEKITLRRKIAKIRRTGFGMAATDAELEKSFEDMLILRQKEVDAEKNYKTLLLKIINIRQFTELHKIEYEFMKRILEILRDKQPNKSKKDDDDD